MVSNSQPQNILPYVHDKLRSHIFPVRALLICIWLYGSWEALLLRQIIQNPTFHKGLVVNFHFPHSLQNNVLSGAQWPYASNVDPRIPLQLNHFGAISPEFGFRLLNPLSELKSCLSFLSSASGSCVYQQHIWIAQRFVVVLVRRFWGPEITDYEPNFLFSTTCLLSACVLSFDCFRL